MGRIWQRMFAAGYDRFQAPAEQKFFGPMRRQMLAELSGRVVEIGAGTGASLPHYPSAVEEVVCVEPAEPMARRLEQKAAGVPVPARVVHAPAEALPFEDDSFDAAVSTLVLCTVDDQAATLREVARVLRPGGRFVFIEHVRAPEPGLAAWQDRLHPLWVRFGVGCHCNRPTYEAIEASPLVIESHRRGRIPKAIPIVRPLLTGVAVAP